MLKLTSIDRRRRRLPAAVIIVSILFAVQFSAGRTSFTSPAADPFVTDDGTVQLVWEESNGDASSDRFYEVRRWKAGAEGAGVLVYEGQDTASFLSGLPEGEYELKARARGPDEEFPEWGEDSLSVKVEYIGSGLVIGLMSVGFVTFVAIVLSIALGHRASRGYVAEES